jgi:hypothetical protein
MLCFVVKGLERIRRLAVRIVKAVVARIEDRVRRLWRGHGHRMKSDASYAAAAAVVLGSVFGVVPVKDAVAAVLAALLGIAMSGRSGRTRDTYGSGVSRWDSGYEWDSHADFA